MNLSVEQVVQQAVTEQDSGNLEEAERLYRAVLDSDSKHPEANHNLGVLIISQNKIASGLILLKAALDGNPNNEQFWISYIAILIKEGDFENAKKKIKEARSRGFQDEKFDDLESAIPSSNTPSRNETDELIKNFQSGRYAEALDSGISIIKKFPDHLLSWKILTIVFGQIGDFDKALTSSQKALQIDPKDPNSHNSHGLILSKLNRTEEAELSCRKAIELKPDFPEAYNNLGIALFRLNKMDEAEANYRKAIELKQDFANAHYNLGLVLSLEDKFEESIKSYEKALDFKENYLNALIGKGEALFRTDQFELALKDFDLCKTKETRALALQCLFGLGRIDDIYERIQMNSELDDENIAVAAFSSFIEAKFKKDTAHNFCKNPMDFIHYSNISSHIKNSNLLINEIIDELYELENIGVSGIPAIKFKDSITLSKVNILENPSEKILKLKSIILKEIDTYHLKFKNKSCSYIQKWPSKKFLNGWPNILKKDGFHSSHNHESGWMSGVIYLNVVPDLEENEGAIEFDLNGENFQDLSLPKLTYQPKLGDIVFFPSSLFHRTIPYKTDMHRITISFDLEPNRVSEN